MRDLIERIQKWFKLRGPRERIYLFILGLVIMYLLCFVLLIKTLSNKKKELNSKIVALQTQKESILNQINVFNTLLKDPIFLKKMKEEKNISSSIEMLSEKLKKMKPMLTTSSDLGILTKNILNHTSPAYTLVNLKDLPAVPWSLPIPNKEDITFETTGIFEDSFVVELKSDYFSTIQYLNWLEKLPYNIYWDSLQYKVLTYPTASITITFHALTYQKS